MDALAFLVNEDDGRNRVHHEWYDGIASGKNIDKFGYIILSEFGLVDSNGYMRQIIQLL